MRLTQDVIVDPVPEQYRRKEHDRLADVLGKHLHRGHTTNPCGGPVADLLKRAITKIKFEELRPFKILGTGTFGVVKLVHHEQSGQTFAMKIIAKAMYREMLATHPSCGDLIPTTR